MSEPRSDERAKIWQQVTGSMNQHECEEIFRSRPDYPEGDATYCQDNNGVGDRIDRARV